MGLLDYGLHHYILLNYVGTITEPRCFKFSRSITGNPTFKLVKSVGRDTWKALRLIPHHPIKSALEEAKATDIYSCLPVVGKRVS